MTPIQMIQSIRPVMLDLRARTQKNYACAVDAGRFQLQLVAYEKRRTIITPLTDWVSLDEVLAAAAQQ